MKQPVSLQDFAMNEIRSKIQSGVYPVRSKLVPQKIAFELDISPTPVVAALNRLTTQGLVEALPRRGFIVKGFSVQDMRNYFDTRIMMESWAAIEATKNIDRFPEIIQGMRDLVDRFDHVSPNDLEAARDLETRFHLSLIKMAGNDQLTRLYEFNWSVGSVFFIYSLEKVKPENFKISLQEHRKLLDALITGDSQKLQDLVKGHLRFLNKAIGWYKAMS